MPVAINRDRDTLTVTVTVDVGDIVGAKGLPAAEKKGQALRRALDHLSEAVNAANVSDAELDAQAAAVTADVARRKAARPTGNL